MQTDGAKSELSELPELEEIPQVRSFEVWVRIKKSSKYYHQGLTDPTNPSSKPRFFKLAYFTPLLHLGHKLSRDAYVLHFNGNAYRIEDCEIFLRDSAHAENFVRLV
jgi:hypothetical protein